ncbi:MAG: hypothetical protein LBU61_01200 [Coriobacteriales bacterium]|nr:hypothetical protein [Coriobacteriales bacterium]
MARPKYDPKELEPTGEFYPGLTEGFGGMPIPPDPILQRPISAMENIQLLVDGKRPYWIPVGGFFNADVQGFRPRINPDNIANHQIFDGGPTYDYTGYGDNIKSWWFDLEWITTDIGGAMFMPGKPKIPDITEWEKYVSMPDLDKMDWDELEAQNVEYLGTGKMNQLGIQCGLWERMMALMDVSEAAVALFDEDLKPHAHRFLDAYCNFLIDYIGRVKARCNIDCVVIHEDWAHQRGPFFSAATASEMLVPYVKRIVDFCHANGMLYEIHMCGAVEKLIPCYFEAGVDMWSAIQPLLYDTGAIVKKYKDQRFVWGITAPLITPDYSEADMRQAAKDFVEEYKDCNIMVSFFSMDEGFPGFHPGFQNAVYEYSRIAFEDFED